jgi:hypothetical protein
LQIYKLQIYSLWIRDLKNGGSLVRILVYRGIIVHSLKVGYILASKVSPKAAYIYRTNLVKWVRYKASNHIKFRTSKEFLSSIILI